ncbi:MAG: type 4a pilus biogenesis protein PilO [Candidatus Goldbacteria bacterium]|nr:type 4a pilus biogenesis protein PilO [Candidatus Goldiibacteriota bacterium]
MPQLSGTKDKKSFFNIKLTKEQQNNIIAAVLFTGFVIFAYVKWWFLPVNNQYKEKVKILEQKRKDLQDAREMVAKYAEFMRRASEIDKRVDFIYKRLPKTFVLSEVIKDVTRVATQNNINIISFEPEQKIINKGEYKEYEIKVNFPANYRNLGKFLSDLGYVERLITPTKIDIQKNRDTVLSDKSQNINISMVLKIYTLSE